MENLKSNNGYVNYLMKAGKDLVKSTMPIGLAKKIIESDKASSSKKHKGYGLCVNGTYYFETISDKKSDKANIKEDNNG